MNRNFRWMLFGIILFLLTVGTVWPPDMTTAGGNEYFNYTLNLELSQTRIKVKEPFSARIHSHATCNKELPINITNGVIKGKVLARLQGNGSEVTLNPGFAIELEGIPGKTGQSFQKEMEIPLVFPGNSPGGNYEVYVRTTAAEFSRVDFWFYGSEYLPAEAIFAGIVECINPAFERNTPAVKTTHAISPAISKIRAFVAATGTAANIAVTEDQSQMPQNAWPMIGGVAGGLLIIALILWRIGFGRRKRG